MFSFFSKKKLLDYLPLPVVFFEKYSGFIFCDMIQQFPILDIMLILYLQLILAF